MNTAVYGLLGTIIVTMGTVIGLLIKNSRKSPETRDSISNAWGQINERVNGELTRMDTEASGMRERLDASDAKNRFLYVKLMWKDQRIAQLISYIRYVLKSEPPEPTEPEPIEQDAK